MNYTDCKKECERLRVEVPGNCYVPKHPALLWHQIHEQPDGKLMALPVGIMAISPEIYAEIAQEVPVDISDGEGWYVHTFSVDDY